MTSTDKMLNCNVPTGIAGYNSIEPATATTEASDSSSLAPNSSASPSERGSMSSLSSNAERPSRQYLALAPPQPQPVYQPDLCTPTDIPPYLHSLPASSSNNHNGPRYSTTIKTNSALLTSTTVASPQSISFNNHDTGVHPSEWSVNQVVAWLRALGFNESVCDKFIEHEITGDLLLELDSTALKDEIGIVQFGMRMRIVNAIQDLQRPPSAVSSVNSNSKPRGNGTGIVYGTSTLVPERLPPFRDIIYSPDQGIRPESEPGSAIAPQIIQPSGYGLEFSGGHARADSTKSLPSSLALDRSGSIHRIPNGPGLDVQRPTSLTFSPSGGALKKRAAVYITERSDVERSWEG